MDAKSEVMLRQFSYLQGHVLLINPPADPLALTLLDLSHSSSIKSCTVWTWDAAHHHYFNTLNPCLKSDSLSPSDRSERVTSRSISSPSFHHVFGVHLPEGQFDQAIIFVPKSKQQLQYVIAQCAARLAIGSSIFLVGEKKAGVEGAAKQLKLYGPIKKIDSARHCQLWQLTLATTLNIADAHLDHWTDHYDIDLAQFYKSYQLQHLVSTQLRIYTCAGVFSQSGLDKGTAVLLPYLSQVQGRRVLDFGCGAGVLSAVLAVLNVNRHVVAVDVDAFALYAAQLTINHNVLSDRITLYPVNSIQDPTLANLPRFSAVVSNPPFHQGVRTHYDVSEQLCAHAKMLLKPKGELWIVANRFLNYGALIAPHFSQCEIKVDHHEFKVFYAT